MTVQNALNLPVVLTAQGAQLSAGTSTVRTFEWANSDITITGNADGGKIYAGYTNSRALLWTGADISITGSGVAVITFPATSQTLIGSLGGTITGELDITRSSGQYGINITSTLDTASSNSIYGAITFTGTGDNYGVYITSTQTGICTSLRGAFFVAIMNNTAAGTVTYLMGMHTSVQVLAASSRPITGEYGLFISTSNSSTAGAVITTDYSIYIVAPTVATSGGILTYWGMVMAAVSSANIATTAGGISIAAISCANTTTNYGINIGGVSGATTNYGIKIGNVTNYSIYTGTGPVRFGDDLTVVGAFGCNGSAAQASYVSGGAVVPGAGAFGYSSAALAAALAALVTKIRVALVNNGIMS